MRNEDSINLAQNEGRCC